MATFLDNLLQAELGTRKGISSNQFYFRVMLNSTKVFLLFQAPRFWERGGEGQDVHKHNHYLDKISEKV